MKIRETVAATLKTFQAQQGLSLTECADAIGIGKSSLQEYMEAKRNLRADTLDLIADKLQIPIETLVSGKADSAPPFDALSDVCQTLHPLLQAAAFEQLRALEKLFHLSDEIYALERQRKSDENDRYRYTSFKVNIKDPSGARASYGMFVKEWYGGSWHTTAAAAPFSEDPSAVFRLVQYCAKLQIPPSQLRDIVEDFCSGRLRC